VETSGVINLYSEARGGGSLGARTTGGGAAQAQNRELVVRKKLNGPSCMAPPPLQQVFQYETFLTLITK
jgi:hypothetical protein